MEITLGIGCQAARISQREVRIVDFPQTLIAAVEHRGSPALEHETVKRLIEWRIANHYPPQQYDNYGIHYHDPRNTPAQQYRADFGIAVPEPVAANPQGVINKIIPAGRCAVTRHLGSRETISAAEYLYLGWLPQSGEQAGDFPLFFHYLNVGPEIQPQDMITDVYLPLLEPAPSLE